MLKKLLIGSVLLSTSLFSQAGIISVIDGADMAGMQVTATFSDGSTDTQMWSATGIDSGAASAADWSLSLSGETFGDVVSPGTFIGAWTLENMSTAFGIVGLEIDGAIADIYFDIVDTTIETVGSGVGREFVADTSDVTASYSNLLSAPDLFGTLNIDWDAASMLSAGNAMQFFTDTDKTTVSEPVKSLMFLSGLVALVTLRRKA